jgi:nucleoside phosphorylase
MPVSVCGVLLVVAATELELESVRTAPTFACGVGPVEAALQTARALSERKPSALLHIGLAGGRGIEPPSLVIGSEAVYCDVVDAANRMRRVERVQPDRALLAAARAALPDALVLPIGTSARVGASTGFEVEAMEGFAVLRAAQLARVPAVELRAVSNSADEDDRSRWRVDEALAALADAVLRVVAALG